MEVIIQKSGKVEVVRVGRFDVDAGGFEFESVSPEGLAAERVKQRLMEVSAQTDIFVKLSEEEVADIRRKK